jgi:hypothetical protein
MRVAVAVGERLLVLVLLEGCVLSASESLAFSGRELCGFRRDLGLSMRDQNQCLAYRALMSSSETLHKQQSHARALMGSRKQTPCTHKNFT